MDNAVRQEAREADKGTWYHVPLSASLASCLKFISSVPFHMSDIVHDVKDAARTCDTNDGNGGISAGEEKIFLQSQHSGGIGVDDSAVREDQHALPTMFAGDIINRCDDAPAKFAGGFAIFDGVPVAFRARDTHNVYLSLLQRLRQSL